MEKAVAAPPAAPGTLPDPLEKIDAVAIAPRHTRKFRAAAFQVYVFGASAVFITLAAVAHWVAYFPVDLTVTRGQPVAPEAPKTQTA